MGFVKKVYSILLVQLGVTAAAVILVCQDVQGYCVDTYYGKECVISPGTYAYWMEQNWGFLILAMILVIMTEITIICVRKLARKVPINFLLLSVFTLAESYMVAYISSYYAADNSDTVI